MPDLWGMWQLYHLIISVTTEPEDLQEADQFIILVKCMLQGAKQDSQDNTEIMFLRCTLMLQGNSQHHIKIIILIRCMLILQDAKQQDRQGYTKTILLQGTK